MLSSPPASAEPSPESAVLRQSLWALTWPLLSSLFLSLSLNFVDATFLSRVSDEAAGAVGALLPVLGVSVMVFSVVAQAGASVAGQLLGAGRTASVPATYAALIGFNLVLGLLTSLTLLALGPTVVRTLGLHGQMATYAGDYLVTVGGFQFLKATQIGFANILNSRGETRWVLAEAAVTNVTNVGLNLAFLTGSFGLPKLGVRGVAFATILSLSIGLVLTMSLVRFRLGIRLPWRTPWSAMQRHIRAILDIAVPAAVEPVSYQFTQMVINSLIVSLGPAVLAARVYCMNLFMLSTILWAVAFGIGGQIAVAHRVGAGRYAEADAMMHRALRIAALGNLGWCLLLGVFHRQILGLLTDDPEVLAAAGPVYWIAPLVEAGRAFNIVAGGALRAVGDARFSAVIGVGVMWLVAVPLCIGFVEHTPLLLGGVWVALAVDETLRGGVNYFRWRRGHWRRPGLAALAAE